jgi:hypothetical protein
MDSQSIEGCQCRNKALEALLKRALLLDLEVSHQGKILKVGATLDDITLSRSGSVPIEVVSLELTRLARAADCLLGHNLIRHDLAVLRERAPTLSILRLPVIDTPFRLSVSRRIRSSAVNITATTLAKLPFCLPTSFAHWKATAKDQRIFDVPFRSRLTAIPLTAKGSDLPAPRSAALTRACGSSRLIPQR